MVIVEILGIISNLETEDAIAFIDLYVKALLNAANDGGDFGSIASELKTIEEVDSRAEVKDFCRKVREF